MQPKKKILHEIRAKHFRRALAWNASTTSQLFIFISYFKQKLLFETLLCCCNHFVACYQAHHRHAYPYPWVCGTYGQGKAMAWFSPLELLLHSDHLGNVSFAYFITFKYFSKKKKNWKCWSNLSMTIMATMTMMVTSLAHHSSRALLQWTNFWVKFYSFFFFIFSCGFIWWLCCRVFSTSQNNNNIEKLFKPLLFGLGDT